MFAAADAAPPLRQKPPKVDADAFTALGWRQTVEPAAKGGKANAKGFRFRNGAMRAFARSFRGQPFLTGHNWGDVRARGGTITDARVQDLEASAELALLFDIDAVAAWAREGLANGTIDRFSLGASPGEGEITCTVHGVPVWSIDECFCFPGELVMDEDGNEVIAEWEYEDPVGEELSAVNVPLIDETFIVDASSSEEEIDRFVSSRIATAGRLAEICGRRHPHIDKLTAGGWLPEGFTAARGRRTMTLQAQEKSMDPREEMAKALGLSVTATWEEIRTKQAQIIAEANVARTQLAASTRELEAARARELEAARASDAAHVESEITRLRATRQVSDEVIADLRTAAAGQGGRAAFDSSLRLVERSAPPAAPAAPPAGTRPALQSDAPPARVDSPAIAALSTEPDAWEQHAANPELPKVMRACKLTPDDVRKHGPRSITVVANLAEIIANSR